MLRRMDHPILGELKVVYGAAKSYITFSCPESGKPKLFLEINSAQSSNHASLLQRVLRASCKGAGLDKAGAAELRCKLLGW